MGLIRGFRTCCGLAFFGLLVAFRIMTLFRLLCRLRFGRGWARGWGFFAGVCSVRSVGSFTGWGCFIMLCSFRGSYSFVSLFTCYLRHLLLVILHGFSAWILCPKSSFLYFWSQFSGHQIIHCPNCASSNLFPSKGSTNDAYSPKKIYYFFVIWMNLYVSKNYAFIIKSKNSIFIQFDWSIREFPTWYPVRKARNDEHSNDSMSNESSSHDSIAHFYGHYKSFRNIFCMGLVILF